MPVEVITASSVTDIATVPATRGSVEGIQSSIGDDDTDNLNQNRCKNVLEKQENKNPQITF